MPDMLFFGQPSKANNYSRKLYQAEPAGYGGIQYLTAGPRVDCDLVIVCLINLESIYMLDSIDSP